jgi:hypothetical protein
MVFGFGSGMLDKSISRYQITQPVSPTVPLVSAPIMPKTVVASLTQSSSPSISSKIIEEIHETPYINTQALHETPQSVSWQKAVIISVVCFFLGVSLTLIIMFFLY